MNDKRENNHTRSGGLVSYFRSNTPVITTSEAAMASFNKILGIHTEVESLDRLMNGAKKASTLTKADARKELVLPGLIVAGAVFSLGVDNNDELLKTKADIQEHEISYRFRDTELVSRLRDVLSQANLNIADMTKYKVTPEILLDLEGKITDFDNTLGGKISGDDAVEVAGKKIDSLHGEITAIIKNELDKRMLPFRQSNPDIYEQYLLVKRLETPGVRHQEEETPTVETSTTDTKAPKDQPGQ